MNVDWNRINSFITEDDEEEIVWLKDTIQTLISNYEQRLSELADISQEKNNPMFISLLHQMKGISSNFGLESLNQITTQAEALAKANEIDAAFQETLKLAPLWIDTKAELKLKLGI